MSVSSRIRQMADEIVLREGGYVNDPDDPGGATKYGVTFGTLRALGQDITGDGRVDISDVRALGRAQARELLIRHYFYRPRINSLPEILHSSVFDMQVNAGSNAIRLLQELLGDLGEPVTIDGIIGPQTLGAARRAAEKAPDHIADAYGIARRDYYYSLADRRPSARKYARRRNGGKGGWITRAERFISPRYHLSDAAHAERVSRWG